MLLFTLLSCALAGSPEVFRRATFFAQPSSYNSNTLEAKVLQLQKIEKDYQDFTSDLLTWGKNYHKLRMQIEKDILAEVLSHTGQSDFVKELSKCGLVDNVETEDMITVKSICASSNKASDLVLTLIQELRTKADNCVNVKEKFRKRINDVYDEYFNSEIQEEIQVFAEEYSEDGTLDAVETQILLQLEESGKRFDKLESKNESPLEDVCEEYVRLSEEIQKLTQKTTEILSELFI